MNARDLIDAVFTRDAAAVAAVLARPTAQPNVVANSLDSLTSGWTPLMCASADGSTIIVEILLAVGASTEDSLENGHTALYLAAREGHTETVRALLVAKAIADAPTTEGMCFSAAEIAEHNGHGATMALLMSNAT